MSLVLLLVLLAAIPAWATNVPTCAQTPNALCATTPSEHSVKVYDSAAWADRVLNTGDLPVSGSEVYVANTFSEFGEYLDDTELMSEDFGAFTCDGTEDGCELNATVAGSGLALDTGTTPDSIDTASQEAAFLADGGTTDLTCTSTQGAGSAQVMDDGSLQICDGAGTPAIRKFEPRHSFLVATSLFYNGGFVAGPNYWYPFTSLPQGLPVTTNENVRKQLVPVDMWCDEMAVCFNDGLTSGETLTLTVRKNGANTTLTCTADNAGGGSACTGADDAWGCSVSLGESPASFSQYDYVVLSTACGGGCPTTAVTAAITMRCWMD